MLEAMPIGVVRFPGTGITDNLADKAKRLGIAAGSSAARERRLGYLPKFWRSCRRRNSANFRLYVQNCAAVVVEGATNLFDDEGGRGYTLLWSRPRKNGD